MSTHLGDNRERPIARLLVPDTLKARECVRPMCAAGCSRQNHIGVAVKLRVRPALEAGVGVDACMCASVSSCSRTPEGTGALLCLQH